MRPLRTAAAAAAPLLVAASAAAHTRLNSPNGGEQLVAGATFTIEWTVTVQHDLENWDLWYSTSGPDGPWIEIATDLDAGDGSSGSIHTYEWTVPDTLSDQVRVRVRMDNLTTDYEDISDGDLSIEPGCPADFNADGLVDNTDVLLFLNAWSSGDPEADLNADGRLDTRDVLAFLNAWVTGCP